MTLPLHLLATAPQEFIHTLSAYTILSVSIPFTHAFLALLLLTSKWPMTNQSEEKWCPRCDRLERVEMRHSPISICEWRNETCVNPLRPHSLLSPTQAAHIPKGQVGTWRRDEHLDTSDSALERSLSARRGNIVGPFASTSSCLLRCTGCAFVLSALE